MESKVSAATKSFINSRDLLFHTYIKLDNHVIKKNARPIHFNRKTGRSFIGKSDNLRVAEHTLITHFNRVRGGIQLLEPIKDDVWMIAYFYYETSKYHTKEGVRRKTLGDLSNHYQIVEDCLETALILENDNQIQAHDFSRILPHHETALEVFLVKMSGLRADDKYWQHIKKFTDPH